LTIVTSPKGLALKHFIRTRFWFVTEPSGAKALGPGVHRWRKDRLKLFPSASPAPAAMEKPENQKEQQRANRGGLRGRKRDNNQRDP